jgi:hypothetical protein
MPTLEKPVTDVHSTPTPLLRLVGGWRGALDGALPPLVFVATNAAVRLGGHHDTALVTAAAAAALTGAALVGTRVARRETLKQALRGLAGLAVAVTFAAWSGEARDFFRPGIYVDAAYAVAFAGSVLLGRPLVQVIYGVLYGRGRGWRPEPALRRVLVTASLGWSLLYTVRAGVQAALYSSNQPEFLALAKVLLGWPLTIAGVALTLGALRRASRSKTIP